MKLINYTFAAFIAITLLAGAGFADVKLKSKQTMAGQTYESTTYIKGKRQRSETMNGSMVSLTQCDLRRSVQLNPASRTYMVSPFAETTTRTVTRAAAPSTGKSGVAETGGVVTTTITTKDTGERKQMFGLTARHLIITMETMSSPDSCSRTNSKIQTDGWYVDADFALDCNYGSTGFSYQNKQTGGCSDRYETKTIGTATRGFPVYEKMTMFDAAGKETYTMVNEVIEFSRATLETALFDVPADYREVSDPSQMYAAPTQTAASSSSSPGLRKSISSVSDPAPVQGEVGPKKAGVVRIGLAGVRTGAVGDSMNAAELSAAIRTTLAKDLGSPSIEVVLLDEATGVEAQAKQKTCDFVLYASVAHKKGGGGFGGMFGQALGSAVGHTGLGAYGNTAANVAGAVATQVIVSAASVSANVRSKDEVTLEIRLAKGDGGVALSRVFKAKARSNGEDIITTVVDQAAGAIAEAAVI